MKNLTIHAQSQRDIKDLNIRAGKNVCCLNADTDHLYVYCDDNLYNIPPDVKADINGLSIAEYTQNETPAALEYCSLLDNVICALESGVVLIIDFSNQSVTPCDYFFEGGISCMKFSPDHEILVVVTKLNFVHVLFTQSHLTVECAESTPIHMETLDNEDFGEKQFITVGWGKKETQFHGSEGKAAAKQVKTANKNSSTDDGSTNISWRADGTLFAISYLQTTDSLRRIKVFSRDGILQYTSEVVDGLDENLAWKPSGNLIATSQELPNKRVITYFEKNGLKHRDFKINLKSLNVKVKNLSWSSDSDILSLLYTDESDNSVVQLWTEKNYHSYLKQTITFKKDNPVLFLDWSLVGKSGKKLFILTPNEQRIYTYRWIIDRSRGKGETDKSVVAVIDGENLLLTNFRDNVVPPPLSQFCLNLGEQINAVVFASGGSNSNSNSLFCVLNDFRIKFYRYADNDYIGEQTFEITWKAESGEKPSSSYSLHNFLWLNEETVLCSLSENDSRLVVMKIVEEQIIIEKEVVIKGSIEHIVQSPTNPKEVYIFQCSHSSNMVTKYSVESGETQHHLLMAETFDQVDIVEINQKDVLVCRTSNHRLYIDDKNISNNVTSFCLHSEFLLLTTLQHTLLCFSLNEQGLNQLMTSDLTVKPWENEGDTTEHFLNLRRVERGSTLVTAVPKDARTILQMPRGNLECVQPRTLSLLTIAQRLSQLNFVDAFDLMRKQRINLNLLYDHDPDSFLTNVEKFITDIATKNPSWMSLFLTELKDEDVTQTTYASCYPHRIGNEKLPEGKVVKVCQVMRGSMENHEKSDELLQSILISLIKGNQNGLQLALEKVKEIKEKDGPVNEALKFLTYLVDVNELFDAALGMYDLDLTMLVAQKSQKDPKEYVPFLNNFKNMKPDDMKFEIDKHLKKFESALSHLVKVADRFEECLLFIKGHELYRTGLKLFPVGSEQYRTVANAYAENLLQNTKYEEAGIMFAKGENFASAVNAYRLAGCWQECIVMAHRAEMSSTDVNLLYKTLVSRLKGEKKFKEAALIASKYMNNFDESISLLCDGKLWIDAWRESVLLGRNDFIDARIKPEVIEYAQHLTMQIQNNRRDFAQHKARLEIVKSPEHHKAKQAQFNMMYDCDINTEEGMNDLMSDTTSVYGSTYGSQMSRTTGRSYRSSKNRRKQQRKLLNLKEGSLFEDLALMRALHFLITSAYSQKAEVHDVIRMLFQFNEDDLAEQLYKELDGFLHFIEVSESKIWDTDNQTDNNPVQKPQFLCGTIPYGLIEPCILHPPKKDSTSWSLDILKRKKN